MQNELESRQASTFAPKPAPNHPPSTKCLYSCKLAWILGPGT